jgi:hypothetical protein
MSELYIPESAKRTLDHRADVASRAEVEKSMSLYKAMGDNAEQYPRKLLPVAAYLGLYEGLEDIRKATGMTLEILRNLGQMHVCRVIIDKRVEQMQRYAHPSHKRGQPGFKIVKRDDTERETPGDRRRMEKISEAVQRGGLWRQRERDGQWGVFSYDDYERAWNFPDVMGALTRDSLSMDAACVWINPTENPEREAPYVYFRPIDASLVQRALQPLPKTAQPEGEGVYTPYKPKIRPQVAAEYAYVSPEGKVLMDLPWTDAGYLIRNRRTTWWTVDYGFSELESALEIIAGLFTAIRYNVDFFTDSHIPPALLVGSGNFSVQMLQDFLSTLVAQVGGGPGRWHKLPALFGDADSKMQVLQLRNGQREDMMWQNWLVFLINLLSAMYSVAGEEINFQAFLSRGGFGDTAQPERVTEAKQSGLIPLAHKIKHFVDLHLVAPWWRDSSTGWGPYKFDFEALEPLDEERELKLAGERANLGLRSVNMMREEMGDAPWHDPLDDELFTSSEKVVREKYPQMEYKEPDTFRETCERVYEEAGGKFARWTDAPAGGQVLNIWQQEHASEIQQQPEGGEGDFPGAPMAGMPGPEGMPGQEPQPGEQEQGPEDEQQQPEPEGQQYRLPLASQQGDEGEVDDRGKKNKKGKKGFGKSMGEWAGRVIDVVIHRGR